MHFGLYQATISVTFLQRVTFVKPIQNHPVNYLTMILNTLKLIRDKFVGNFCDFYLHTYIII
jgi:hypothetical protein